jgi:hypothetical protein
MERPEFCGWLSPSYHEAVRYHLIEGTSDVRSKKAYFPYFLHKRAVGKPTSRKDISPVVLELPEDELVFFISLCYGPFCGCDEASLFCSYWAQIWVAQHVPVLKRLVSMSQRLRQPCAQNTRTLLGLSY